MPSPPGSTPPTSAYGISRDGTATVGRSIGASTPYGDEAVLWAGPDPGQRLGFLFPHLDAYSQATDSSPEGAVVVGFSTQPVGSPYFTAFRWTAASGMTSLGLLPGTDRSRAWGVSDDGSVIVGDSAHRAFRWTAQGGMAALPLPARSAWNVSADGSVVAGTLDYTGSPYLWTEANGIQVLPLPGGATQSNGANVSPDGTAAVGFTLSPSGQGAFRWTAAEGTTALGGLPGGNGASAAWGSSAQGLVVIGRAATPNGDVPMIWDRANGMRALRMALEQEFRLVGALTGWTLTDVNGISADGRTLVGDGINPDGIAQGWIAVLGHACYANCDQSTGTPVLSIADFGCFVDRFAAGDPYANCDGSTRAPVLSVADFVCFLNRFAAGCD